MANFMVTMKSFILVSPTKKVTMKAVKSKVFGGKEVIIVLEKVTMKAVKSKDCGRKLNFLKLWRATTKTIKNTVCGRDQ